MKCIIIDDDNVVRLLLEKYAKRTKFLEILGSYSTPIEAIEDGKLNDIDLIFVDIEMPEMTGLEFMSSMNNLPSVIVISAKEKYAVPALDLDAIDYLLKPIEYPRFLKAVTKVRNYMTELQKKTKPKADSGIFIKDGTSSLKRLRYEEIVWIKALENYVLITTEDAKYTIHLTMKSIISQLPSDKFIRIHRSFIVNVEKIIGIEDNSVIVLFEKRRKQLPIAKGYKDDFLSKIKIISK